MITVQVAKPWHVKTPTVFRYMEQKYINEFFETGCLRLSTFAAFSKHEDEQRHDAKEGRNIVVGTGEEHTIFAVTGHGHRSLIFCTSTRADDGLMRAFDTNGYFKIKDTTQFGAAIASKIAGFKSGLEGFCDYKDRRTIERDIGSFRLDDLKEHEGDENLSLNKLASKVFETGGPDVFFVKFFVKLKKYSDQNEYRFVWNVSHEVEEALIVECPEAIQFLAV